MKARDHSRTPMQWSTAANAGFCAEGVKPWMRVMEDYKTINVEAQKNSTDDHQLSVWQFWQRGLLNRKEHKDVFVYGDYQELSPEDPSIFAYERTAESGKWLVVLNFSGKMVAWEIPETTPVDSWACSTYTKSKAQKATTGAISLEPWEGLLGQCK